MDISLRSALALQIPYAGPTDLFFSLITALVAGVNTPFPTDFIFPARTVDGKLLVPLRAMARGGP